MQKSKKIKVNQDQNNKREQELEIQLKRTLADYQNLERRIEAERKLLGELSTIVLIEKFLPILDNLENAQKHLNDQGLALVIKQFNDTLTSEGVVEIVSEGQDYDPNLHEAIETVEGSEDGKIMKVLAKGYKMGDRVIRAAKVSVVKSDVNTGKDLNHSENPIQENDQEVTNA